MHPLNKLKLFNNLIIYCAYAIDNNTNGIKWLKNEDCYNSNITVHANLLYMQFPYIFRHKIKRTRIPIPILSRVP